MNFYNFFVDDKEKINNLNLELSYKNIPISGNQSPKIQKRVSKNININHYNDVSYTKKASKKINVLSPKHSVLIVNNQINLKLKKEIGINFNLQIYKVEKYFEKFLKNEIQTIQSKTSNNIKISENAFLQRYRVVYHYIINRQRSVS